MPLFANAAEDFGHMIIHGLAVAGAAAVGYVLTLGLVWLIGRLAFNRQAPRPVKRILATLGSVAVGLLALAMLFNNSGGAGWGFGPGMGFGTGTGSPSIDSSPATSRSPETAASAKVKPPSDDPGVRPLLPLRIRMLGGDKVRDERFYLVEDSTQPMTLSEIKNHLRQKRRKDDGVPAFREVAIVITPESVASDHPAVRQLFEFVRNDLQLSVSIQRTSDQ
jgi:hypothetical protein